MTTAATNRGADALAGLTVTFRAKRQTDVTYWDGDGMPCGRGDGYRVPLLTTKHVRTPRSGWSTANRIHLADVHDPRSEDVARARQDAALRPIGIPGGMIVEDSHHVTISPRGNGFMADITITFPTNGED